MKYSSLILICIALFVFSCDPVSKLKTEHEDHEVHLTKEVKHPKNIIFLIGDGMGISQITAGMYSNNNQLQLENFPVVGIHKSYSSDNLITDSAAGATAFACGQKSYNGAIAVDVNKKPIKTILEYAEDKDLKTGLVATSTIVHATPACFIAHVEQRKMYEDIALEFLKTDIDFFAGGGTKYFNEREDNRNLINELKAKGYTIQDSTEISDLSAIDPFGAEKYGLLTAYDSPLKVREGRTYLPEVSKKAIDFLNRKDESNKGFFLMIEGSQIDWGGHANDADYIITEMMDFDKTIKNALDFARMDGETLVIVTADHETGGFAINGGSKFGDLKTGFTTGHHTADLIPVFAFGPGSEKFGGIYENTAIYFKMMEALQLNDTH